MASVTHRPNGDRWLQFTDNHKKRQTIRLGRVSAKVAGSVCTRVDELMAASMTNVPIERDLAQWLSNVDDSLHSKFAKVGLCPPRGSTLLVPFIKAYVASRTDVKPATKEVWRQGEKGMVDFLGANAALRDVTPGDADRYKLHMIGSKLAPMTIRKRLQFATMVFRAAVRQRLIVDSPFTGVTVKGTMPNRERFVTQDETRRLLIACPNHHWRSVISLARYGGLRCPSEVLSLRWEDIDWAGGKILVTSPKTEHHPGKGTRRIPLFPELKAVLDEALNLADKDAVYVVDESMRKACRGPGGWMNVNLRTTFLKIIKRAGLAQWPRLFHNLRSSRQTELAETFPAHVVCDWLGNSEAVAMKHYLQTTDDHFSRAAGGSPKAKQSRAADDDDDPANPKADARSKAKQKAKQSGAAKARADSLPERKNPGNAERNDNPRNPTTTQTDGVGFEPTRRFHVCRFSRPVHSTALPPIQIQRTTTASADP